ncbi:MAG: hypothetical protein ABSG62_24525 [Terracidiphilus sp.]|jgi:hypothetical protein
MSRNQQIIRANHRSPQLEIGTYQPIIHGGLAGKVQHRNTPQIRIQRCLVLLPSRRHLNPILKLRFDDCGNAHVAC